MSTRQIYLTRATVLALIMTLAYVTTPARDGEFNSLVKEIEARYGARRMRIPFLGLASFMFKVVRPVGVKGFKLAVFEDHDFSACVEDNRFGAFMREALSEEWRPLVRVHSRRDGERTYIYAKDEGNDLHLMIVTIESREAVVVQVRVNPQSLSKWLKGSPKSALG
jgi:hypothetical protein